MRKKCSIILFALICIIISGSVYASSVVNTPSRTINVVYDDSGSMYEGGVDTWCSAKYSMEVFASMLGEKDTMNVYYMSDYEVDTTAGPRIKLEGKNGAQANVAQIHNQTTVARNTPFNSVRKAYSDLNAFTGDEKWLVILTDGAFEDGTMPKSEVDNFLAAKSKDIKVMFLSMGPDAQGITDKPENNIYFVEAKTSKDILNKITEISTRIFNSNKLKINNDDKSIEFDTPMSELTVFAQGANVSINGIKDADGNLTKSSSPPVSVKYSNCDASNYQNPPTTDLVGSIATFSGNFTNGKYTLDVSNATTIDVYYKPNIEVKVLVENENGDDVTEESDLYEGEYKVTAKLIRSDTKEEINNSNTLGNIDYQTSLKLNGEKKEGTFSNGEKIKFDEGDLEVDVTAKYLDFNSMTTTLKYHVYRNKEVAFTTTDNPTFTVTSGGITTKDPVKIEAKIDGREITKEEWAKMDTPQVKIDQFWKDYEINDPKIEKSDKIGVFNVYPALPNDKPSSGNYKDCKYKINYNQNFGSEAWKGEAQENFHFDDQRSWFERNWFNGIRLAVLLLILFIVAGYLPIFKHYLPKSLKKRPYVECIPKHPGNKRQDSKGLVEKSLLSTILPYVAQKGTIRYVPKGVYGAPVLKVKGIKKRRMRITNISVFEKSPNITFNGEAITPDCKRFDTGAGVNIEMVTKEWRYLCTPNQSSF